MQTAEFDIDRVSTSVDLHAHATLVRTSLLGQSLLNQPLLNKDTAFTAQERESFKLEGLLPSRIDTFEQQVKRAYESIMRKTDPLERYIGLIALQDRNEHVFYRLLSNHTEEFLPIIYTPTVGQACEMFSHIYRRPRGVWITPEHRGRIEHVLHNVPSNHVRMIVATDNERILGLGDLGAGGMGIPIGKLTLYTLAAGIHPCQALPVSLDVGTDNQRLLTDGLYVGWRHSRLRGEAYVSFLEEFVAAVQHCFPGAILQWEDFKHINAFVVLDRYHQRLPSFNDDIQGTAAVVLSALLTAKRVTGVPMCDQRMVILGAGGAGIGIARLLRQVFRQHGLESDQLRSAIAVLDSHGLIHEGRAFGEPSKREVAWTVNLTKAHGLPTEREVDLESVVRAVRPTVLIGTSGTYGMFTRQVVQAMATAVHRPVILPLSNPTNRSEATPSDIITWTEGRAIVATGSPYEPVSWQGKTFHVGQANNIWIFPGIGLASLLTKVHEITDGMFMAAAEAVSKQVSHADLVSGAIFPSLAHLRQVTAKVAEAVICKAREEGNECHWSDEQIPERISEAMWEATYPKLIPEGASP